MMEANIFHLRSPSEMARTPKYHPAIEHIEKVTWKVQLLITTLETTGFQLQVLKGVEKKNKLKTIIINN